MPRPADDGHARLLEPVLTSPASPGGYRFRTALTAEALSSNLLPTERAAISACGSPRCVPHIKGCCLDVRDRSAAEDAPLQLWLCDYYATAQQFKFVDAPW